MKRLPWVGLALAFALLVTACNEATNTSTETTTPEPAEAPEPTEPVADDKATEEVVLSLEELTGEYQQFDYLSITTVQYEQLIKNLEKTAKTVDRVELESGTGLELIQPADEEKAYWLRPFFNEEEELDTWARQVDGAVEFKTIPRSLTTLCEQYPDYCDPCFSSNPPLDCWKRKVPDLLKSPLIELRCGFSFTSADLILNCIRKQECPGASNNCYTVEEGINRGIDVPVRIRFQCKCI